MNKKKICIIISSILIFIIIICVALYLYSKNSQELESSKSLESEEIQNEIIENTTDVEIPEVQEEKSISNEDENQKEINTSIVQEEKEEAPKHPKVVVSQSLTGRPSKLGANKKKIRLRKGDAVEHTIYGQGVVLEIRGDVATIAFGHTIGVKKLNASHPSLKKA